MPRRRPDPERERHGCATPFWRSPVPTGGAEERRFVAGQGRAPSGVPEFRGVELRNASCGTRPVLLDMRVIGELVVGCWSGGPRRFGKEPADVEPVFGEVASWVGGGVGPGR